MAKVMVFNQVTVDGFFTTLDGDISWAHAAHDPEWNAFISDNAKGNGRLVFGRKTYEMMVSYWPTPAAAKKDPVVAEGMNRLPKIVFSRTLEKVAWENTKLVKGDLTNEVRKLKDEPGDDLVIMGSGTVVAQLARENLIDEYQLITFPIVLGKGRTLFEGVAKPLSLKRTTTRTFKNGNVLVCYEAG